MPLVPSTVDFPHYLLKAFTSYIRAVAILQFHYKNPGLQSGWKILLGMSLSLMESGSSRLGVTLDPLLPYPHFPRISLLHSHTPITWFKMPLTPDSQFHITALLIISKADFIQRQTSNPMNSAASGFDLPPQHYNPDSQGLPILPASVHSS
ncbi:hypothetical protein ACOMHN_015217 [Nucella lapillus]